MGTKHENVQKSYIQTKYEGDNIDIYYNATFAQAYIYNSKSLRNKLNNMTFTLKYDQSPHGNCQICSIGNLDAIMGKFYSEGNMAYLFKPYEFSADHGILMFQNIIHEIREALYNYFSYEMKLLLIDIDQRFLPFLKKAFGNAIKLEVPYTSTNGSYMCIMTIKMREWRPTNILKDFTKSGVNTEKSSSQSTTIVL